MNGPNYLPLVAWSLAELIDEADRLRRKLDAIGKEAERRGGRDEKRHGFAVPIRQSPGVIETAYRHFPTAAEAYDAAREQWPDDESAPYKIHPVYLGKDDEISVGGSHGR